MKKKTKKVKGWAIVTRYRTHLMYNNEQACVYPTKYHAEAELSEYINAAPGLKVVPCTITYSLPTTQDKE